MMQLQKISLFSFVGTILLLGSGTFNADAQMMGVKNFGVTEEVYEHAIREEVEGKELWERLQAKEVACADLNDEQFGILGEYFMGAMMGEAHPAMNAMMVQMHGEEGEEQIHIVMGKRLSACDTSAIASGISGGWMPMMNMMGGGWSFDGAQDRSSPFGFNNQSNNSMMNFGFGPFGGFGWIFMILWWVLIIAGIVALVRWIAGQSRGGASGGSTGLTAGKSALDILKERYAKGEINKQEFEEKKQDLLK